MTYHAVHGAKKLSGRKRHLFVDTFGLVLQVLVHPADIPDRVDARWLLRQLQPVATTLPRLELIWADAGYLGHCRRESGRPSVGAYRSSSDRADADNGCVSTNGHHCGLQASSCFHAAGLLSGRSPGLAEIAA